MGSSGSLETVDDCHPSELASARDNRASRGACPAPDPGSLTTIMRAMNFLVGTTVGDAEYLGFAPASVETDVNVAV